MTFGWWREDRGRKKNRCGRAGGKYAEVIWRKEGGEREKEDDITVTLKRSVHWKWEKAEKWEKGVSCKRGKLMPHHLSRIWSAVVSSNLALFLPHFYLHISVSAESKKHLLIHGTAAICASPIAPSIQLSNFLFYLSLSSLISPLRARQDGN